MLPSVCQSVEYKLNRELIISSVYGVGDSQDIPYLLTPRLSFTRTHQQHSASYQTESSFSVKSDSNYQRDNVTIMY